MSSILHFGTDKRAGRFPAVTLALIAVNVVVYAWMMSVGRTHAIDSLGLFSHKPSLSSIISSMFTHAGFLHLGWNMLFLLAFGPRVESTLGRVGYAFFYLGSGVAAALLHVFVITRLLPGTAQFPMVGASGAIAGILGVYAIRFYKAEVLGVPAIFILSGWFLQQLYVGAASLRDPASGGVAYWSHIGGMVFGMVVAAITKMGLEASKEYLITDARAHANRGHTGGAIANLQALIARDPENAEAHANLARLYAEKQEPEQAAEHFRRSIEIYLSRGQRDKAALRYDEMRALCGRAELDLRTEYQIARYLMETCCHKPAVQLFRSISQNHPGTPEGEVALMKAGDISLECLREPTRAVACYERFLREYPHSSYRATVEKALAEAKKQIG